MRASRKQKGRAALAGVTPRLSRQSASRPSGELHVDGVAIALVRKAKLTSEKRDLKKKKTPDRGIDQNQRVAAATTTREVSGTDHFHPIRLNEMVQCMGLLVLV